MKLLVVSGLIMTCVGLALALEGLRRDFVSYDAPINMPIIGLPQRIWRWLRRVGKPTPKLRLNRVFVGVQSPEEPLPSAASVVADARGNAGGEVDVLATHLDAIHAELALKIEEVRDEMLVRDQQSREGLTVTNEGLRNLATGSVGFQAWGLVLVAFGGSWDLRWERVTRPSWVMC